MKQVLYKAKVACRVGGAFRRAGEVFPLPEFEATPPFLEVAGETEDPPKKAPRKPKATAPGPMPSDLPGVERD